MSVELRRLLRAWISCWGEWRGGAIQGQGSDPDQDGSRVLMSTVLQGCDFSLVELRNLGLGAQEGLAVDPRLLARCDGKPGVQSSKSSTEPFTSGWSSLRQEWKDRNIQRAGWLGENGSQSMEDWVCLKNKSGQNEGRRLECSRVCQKVKDWHVRSMLTRFNVWLWMSVVERTKDHFSEGI